MSRELCYFFSSRRRHTRLQGDWSSDVCSSDLDKGVQPAAYGLAPAQAPSPEAGRRHSDLPGQSRWRAPSHYGDAVAPSRAHGSLWPQGNGRAAGRGKGEISVGGGSIKKKKKRKT